MTAWVITGMSGAGKATALRALERAGVECVDNLPAELLPAFAGLARSGDAAVVVDARQGQRLRDVLIPDGTSVLFLEARDDVLHRRAAESTRPHPCATAGSLEAAIRAERSLLETFRAGADLVLDTSELTVTQLEERVRAVVLPQPNPDDDGSSVRVTISSFGHKFGPQTEADWVLDARLVRNPFWVDELRPLTGLDPAVRDYVMADPAAAELVRRGAGVLTWALQRYAGRGRRYLHIAVGCTGGRHRSVVLAEAMAPLLRDTGVEVTVRHRDVDKPDPRDG